VETTRWTKEPEENQSVIPEGLYRAEVPDDPEGLKYELQGGQNRDSDVEVFH
jgi:hypothetical protein